MVLKYNIKNNLHTQTHVYFRPSDSDKLDDIKLILEDDDKIMVYTNNEDENQNNSYNNIRDYIDRIINKTGFLCKGLNPEYISDSFENVDAVVIISDSPNILPNGNIFGFALINFDETTNSIYIDVICSHTALQGVGDILINEVQHISKKLLMTYIYLTSVKSAISFYEKYGFTKQEEICDDMCLMIKSMNKKSGGKKRRRTKKGKQTKIKKTRKNRRVSFIR
jgi:ribosomal protein S18 acetylase RimI-like enzyme